MRIKVEFKHYPAAGKFIKCGARGSKYYVSHDGAEHRLPKFLWNKI